QRHLDLDAVEGPALPGVGRARETPLEADRDRLFRAHRVQAEERRQIERVEDTGALHEGALLFLPGLAAIFRAHDLAELADDPPVLRVRELDAVEDRIRGGEALAARDVRFHGDLAGLPRAAAVVGGSEDRAVADRPGVLAVERVDGEQVERLPGPA